MTDRRRWVRRTASKRPVDRHGLSASSTRSKTWTSYRSALVSDAGVGLGYVLGDGIGCVDLDHCLTDGVPSPVVADLLAECPATYVEVSPSGDGLHVFGLLHEGPGTVMTVWGTPVEVYSVGRYMTVTGERFGDCPRYLGDLTDWAALLRSERD